MKKLLKLVELMPCNLIRIEQAIVVLLRKFFTKTKAMVIALVFSFSISPVATATEPQKPPQPQEPPQLQENDQTKKKPRFLYFLHTPEYPSKKIKKRNLVARFSLVLSSAKQGDLQTLERILKEDSWRVNETSYYTGDTVLHSAVRYNHKEMVQFLLKNGAKVKTLNKRHESPLHLAARRGHWEIMEILISAFPPDSILLIYYLNIRNNMGATPLELAVQNNHWKTVKVMLKNRKKVDISARNRYTGKNALHIASEKGFIKIAKLLLSNDKAYPTYLKNRDTLRRYKYDYINDRNLLSGNTAAHYAAENRHWEMLEFLEKNGADLSLKNYKLRTPRSLRCSKTFTP